MRIAIPQRSTVQKAASAQFDDNVLPRKKAWSTLMFSWDEVSTSGMMPLYSFLLRSRSASRLKISLPSSFLVVATTIGFLVFRRLFRICAVVSTWKNICLLDFVEKYFCCVHLLLQGAVGHQADIEHDEEAVNVDPTVRHQSLVKLLLQS